jgi:hypothetical protein
VCVSVVCRACVRACRSGCVQHRRDDAASVDWDRARRREHGCHARARVWQEGAMAIDPSAHHRRDQHGTCLHPRPIHIPLATNLFACVRVCACACANRYRLSCSTRSNTSRGECATGTTTPPRRGPLAASRSSAAATSSRFSPFRSHLDTLGMMACALTPHRRLRVATEQLPPVVDNILRGRRDDEDDSNVFAFNAESWPLCIDLVVQLTQVFRQKDARCAPTHRPSLPPHTRTHARARCCCC